MKIHVALSLIGVLSLVGCIPRTPPLTDESIVSTTVDGVELTYRYAILPPVQFTPVNEEYRALYNASVMNRPDFGGKLMRYLNNGETYTVAGKVENGWFAIAGEQQELVGYVPLRAGVKSELWEKTVKADSRRKRVKSNKPAKPTCVAVAGESKACQSANNGTWIID